MDPLICGLRPKWGSLSVSLLMKVKQTEASFAGGLGPMCGFVGCSSWAPTRI